MPRVTFEFRPDEPRCCCLPARGCLIIIYGLGIALTIGSFASGYSSIAALILSITLGLIAIGGTIYNSPIALGVVLGVSCVQLGVMALALAVVPVYVAAGVGSGRIDPNKTVMGVLTYGKASDEMFSRGLAAGFMAQAAIGTAVAVYVFQYVLIRRVFKYAREYNQLNQ